MRFKWPTEKMSCVNSVAMKQNMRIPIHKQINRAPFTNKNEPIIYFIDDTSGNSPKHSQLLNRYGSDVHCLPEHFGMPSRKIKNLIYYVFW